MMQSASSLSATQVSFIANGKEFACLHGDLEQASRENRLKKFRKEGSNVILVATDVASRGLDIDDVDVVI